MLKIFKTKEVKTPERTGKNSGFDFFIPNIKEPHVVEPYGNITISLGIKVRIPKNYVLIAFNKSGIATKLGLIVGACVIDENYTGEIYLNLINTTEREVELRSNMKAIQFILIKQVYHDICICLSEETMYKNFNKKERGSSGFGSTGI